MLKNANLFLKFEKVSFAIMHKNKIQLGLTFDQQIDFFSFFSIFDYVIIALKHLCINAIKLVINICL